MTDIERLTELFSQRELFENAFKEYFKAHFDWQIVTTFDKEDVKEDSIAIFFSEGAGRAEGESRNAPLTGGYREQGRFDCSLSIVVTSRRRNRDKRDLDLTVAKLRGLMTRGMLFRSRAHSTKAAQETPASTSSRRIHLAFRLMTAPAPPDPRSPPPG